MSAGDLVLIVALVLQSLWIAKQLRAQTLGVRIIEKPVVQVVATERVVEKPTVQIERIETPVFVDRMVQPDLSPLHAQIAALVDTLRGAPIQPSRPTVTPRDPVLPSGTVHLTLTDADERGIVANLQMRADRRKTVVMHGGKRFLCARGSAAEGFIYRQESA